MSGNANYDVWIAGAFAAFTVDILFYPLDTLKTRYQSPNYNKLFINESTNTIKKAALFRGLYQGLGSVILATLPSSGLFFTTYESSKSFLSSHNSQSVVPQFVINSAASSIAEICSCAILTPAEVIKQNAQMVIPTSSSSKPAVSATLQTLSKFRSNPLALWRGYTALVGRNLPYTALQFPFYEFLKAHIRDHRHRTKLQTSSGSVLSRNDISNAETVLETGLVTGVAGGIAGAVVAVITTPIDVVKTRIMLSAGDDHYSLPKSSTEILDSVGNKTSLDESILSKSKSTKGHKSVLQVAREVVDEKGYVRGLFRGGLLRSVWTMLGTGLYLGVYESTRIWLREREEIER